nr:hypothetical protein GCM10025732_23380 [Glycomyces mayteni]
MRERFDEAGVVGAVGAEAAYRSLKRTTAHAARSAAPAAVVAIEVVLLWRTVTGWGAMAGTLLLVSGR